MNAEAELRGYVIGLVMGAAVVGLVAYAMTRPRYCAQEPVDPSERPDLICEPGPGIIVADKEGNEQWVDRICYQLSGVAR